MTDCFCIKKPGFDFLITVVDKETIIYNDISRWMEEASYVIPIKHEVTVVLPNSSTVTIEVTPQSSTVIKASDLGVSKFTDGIYCFSLDPDSGVSGGCGQSQSKSTGIFPNVECCMYAAYSKLDDSRYDEIREVEIWLNSAKQSSDLGQEKQALEEYRVASRKLNKLNCDCNC